MALGRKTDPSPDDATPETPTPPTETSAVIDGVDGAPGNAVNRPVTGTMTTAERRFDTDSLRDMNTLDDVFKLAQESGLAMESVTDYGDGFDLLKDKRQLIGQPFALVQWSFHPGDYGDFVVAFGVTEDGRKFILPDGSTGIYKQLADITAERRQRNMPPVEAQAMLLCKGGLRVSDYTFTNDAGVETPASTFYLA